MDQDDLLLEVSQVLERLRIPYFVTGSIATIFYGEPRFTNDIDIVVVLEGSTVSRLVEEFSPDDFYLSLEVVDRELSDLPNKDAALLPPGQLGDELIRRGQLHVDLELFLQTR